MKSNQILVRKTAKKLGYSVDVVESVIDYFWRYILKFIRSRLDRCFEIRNGLKVFAKPSAIQTVINHYERKQMPQEDIDHLKQLKEKCLTYIAVKAGKKDR